VNLNHTGRHREQTPENRACQAVSVRSTSVAERSIPVGFHYLQAARLLSCRLFLSVTALSSSGSFLLGSEAINIPPLSCGFKNFENGGGGVRNTIYKSRRHLSQIHITDCMSFTRKRLLFEKNSEPFGGLPPRPLESATPQFCGDVWISLFIVIVGKSAFYVWGVKLYSLTHSFKQNANLTSKRVGWLF